MEDVQTSAAGGHRIFSEDVEWLDTKAVSRRFGLSKPHLYNLLAEGKIRGSSIRRRGATRGRRLWLADSIRSFIEANEQ